MNTPDPSALPPDQPAPPKPERSRSDKIIRGIVIGLGTVIAIPVLLIIVAFGACLIMGLTR